MPATRRSALLAQLKRLVLITAGLAPLVALALIGLSRLKRQTPEWVYWQAELIFLLALKTAYEATAVLSLVGTLALGCLLFRGRRKTAPTGAGTRPGALHRPHGQPGPERVSHPPGLDSTIASAIWPCRSAAANPLSATKFPPCGLPGPSGTSPYAHNSQTRRVIMTSIWS